MYLLITLRASCGAVYCNRSCLWFCLFVGACVSGSVTTITRNCVHRSSPNWFVGKGSDHLPLIKFWPSCYPGKGVCGGAKFFGSTFLQPARSVCVSPSAFSFLVATVKNTGQQKPMVLQWKKHSEEMQTFQTLRAGCSKAEPKIFAPPLTPFSGVRDGQNLISWRWSQPLPTNQFGEDRCTQFRVILVTDPHTNTHTPTHPQQTGAIAIHCATAIAV